jgi:hypothetical protein
MCAVQVHPPKAPARRATAIGAGAGTLIVCAVLIVFTFQSRAATLSAARSRPPATLLYGLTVDDIGNVPELVRSLRRLPRRPTTRIVFDLGQPAGYYAGAAAALRPVSYLMGELLDSSDETHISAAAYRGRVNSYLAELGSKIDVWEIGNEVNGNWLGPYPDVEAKLLEAYDAVSAAHQRTALTLYYDVGCGDGPSELDPLAFSRRYVPARVRNGLGFVLLSYYEQQCGGIRPSAAAWQRYFTRLHALYPHAKVGFGEIGLTDPADASTLRYALGMIRYYYGLPIDLPYYVGGYFWWYFAEDCVPYDSKLLFGALRGGFTAEAAALRRRL